jgi:hypothetical protein
VDRGKNFSIPPFVAFLGLLIKYTVLFCYGLTAVLVGIPTFAQVSNGDFELTWPVVISVLSLLTGSGVILSWCSDSKTQLEHYATLALIMWLSVYAIALAVRGIATPMHGTLATAWLPLAFCTFPALRVVMLTARERKHRRK